MTSWTLKVDFSLKKCFNHELLNYLGRFVGKVLQVTYVDLVSCIRIKITLYVFSQNPLDRP